MVDDERFTTGDAGISPSVTRPPSAVTIDDDALAGALSQQFQRWVPPGAAVASPVQHEPSIAAQEDHTEQSEQGERVEPGKQSADSAPTAPVSMPLPRAVPLTVAAEHAEPTAPAWQVQPLIEPGAAAFVEPLVEPAQPVAGEPMSLSSPASLAKLLAAGAYTPPEADVAPAVHEAATITDESLFAAASPTTADAGADADREAAADESAPTPTAVPFLPAPPADVSATAVTPAGRRAGRHSAGHTADDPSTALAVKPARWVEVTGLQATAASERVGRSVQLFWVWFAVNASVVSVALGAVILGLGVSLRQAVLSVLIGAALSIFPLAVGTLAGKRSNQPTMVVSRATFGTIGNGIPAVLALVTRVAWAAALLWMLAIGVTEVLVGAGLVGEPLRLTITLAVALVGLVFSATVALIGFRLIALVTAGVSALSVVLVAGLIVFTAPSVDLAVALSVPDGDWVLLVSGAVVVFSVLGLAWANSGADIARYQRAGTTGSSAVFVTVLGATLPAVLLISWGAVLAASNATLSDGLQSNPIDLLSSMLPAWYPAPLIAAVALGLLAASSVSLYSAGFAVLAAGVRVPRLIGVTLAVLMTAALVGLLLLTVSDVTVLFRDALTTLAVPVAAWAGIFGAETLLRRHRVHGPSLLSRGGVYPAVRWVNLGMLVVITGVGWGLSTATMVGLQWQGYLFAAVQVDAQSALAASDPGVLIALVLGILTPLILGIPGLRRLQRAERAAAEAGLS
jgi:purine-cytosine permease-like protein